MDIHYGNIPEPSEQPPSAPPEPPAQARYVRRQRAYVPQAPNTKASTAPVPDTDMPALYPTPTASPPPAPAPLPQPPQQQQPSHYPQDANSPRGAADEQGAYGDVQEVPRYQRAPQHPGAAYAPQYSGQQPEQHPSAPHYTTAPAHHHSHRMLFIGFGTLAVIVVGLFTYGLYAFMADTNSPLYRMVGALADVETYAYDTELSYETKNQTSVEVPLSPYESETIHIGSSIAVEAHAATKMDYTVRERARSETAVDLEYDARVNEDAVHDAIAFDLLTDGAERFYFQIRTLPTMFAEMGLGPLEGRWLVFDAADLEAYVMQGGYRPDEPEETREWTTSNVQRMVRNLERRGVLTLGEPLDDEPYIATGDVSVTRYPILVDRDAVREFADELFQTLIDKQEMTKLEARTAAETLNFFLNAITVETAELWLTEAYLPHRIRLAGSISYDDRELVEHIDPAIAQEMREFNTSGHTTQRMELGITFGTFNAPVSIVFPSNAQSLDSLMREFERGTLSAVHIFDGPRTAADIASTLVAGKDTLNGIGAALSPFTRF